jgi:hypothetical protein
MSGGASVADLFADLLNPAGTPAKPAKVAKNRAGIGAADDSAPCEGLRKSANPQAEQGAFAADSQEFAAPRRPENRAQSEHPCGLSQDSQLSQGSVGECASAPSPAEPESRPYRLTRAEGDATHAEPWDERACARFVARVSLFMRRGINATDADDLAERLHLRDVQGDDRRLCIECAYLAGRAASGWRCGNARAAGVASDLPADLATMAQRCAGFKPTT